MNSRIPASTSLGVQRYCKINFAVRLLALFLCHLSITSAGKLRRWEAFPTDVSILLADSVNFSLYSPLACMMRGNSLSKFVNLACYIHENCLLAHANLSVVSSTQTEGWICHASNRCTTPAGAVLGLGEAELDTACPADYVRVCTTSGLVMTLVHPKKLVMKTSCSAPFTATSYGCLSINTTGVTACEARKRCQRVGGDLVSPGTHDDYNTLVSYLRTQLSSNAIVWVGAFRYADVWAYIRNGRDPGTPNGPEWAVDEPNYAPNVFCASIKLNKGLADRPCDTIYPFVCEVSL